VGVCSHNRCRARAAVIARGAMAHVTVLGAGLVTGPLVRYLLESTPHTVTVAARQADKARALIGSRARGSVAALDMNDPAALDGLVRASDLMVSMLPYTQHVAVAERCLAHRKHMLTTSYVSPAMRALDGRAKEAGVVFLNELGLDPGIDHMSAMRVIHGVRAAGGRVTTFRSYCGGLPAPDSNDNPFGYKFSWSPRGVVLAARNPARFLRDGDEVFIPGERLFAQPEIVEFPGLGAFEGYPNRNSLDYIPSYGLEGVRTMFRGTLRNSGHCETWKAMGELGLFDDTARSFAGGSYADVMASLADDAHTSDVVAAVAKKLGIGVDSAPIRKLAWLGMFDREALASNPISPLDALVARMLEKLQYKPGERDMILLRHEFVAEFAGGRSEKIESTLIDFGVPHGETAMSRTVGLPAAIGVARILDGTIATPGILQPVTPAIYEPILDELARLGVAFKETRSPA